MTSRPCRALRRLAAAGALVVAAPAIPALHDGVVAGVAAARPGSASWGTLGAQVAPPNASARRGWTAVRVSKWALLGATVGLGYYALKQSTRADRAYGDLRHMCVETPISCKLDAGRYPDVHAEALYATSLRHDRRAQAGILGGQVTLLASAALFVYDLRNGRTPGNIPYPGVPPQLEALPGARRDAVLPATPAPRFAPRAAPPTLIVDPEGGR